MGGRMGSAFLVLEDGTVFKGESIGAKGIVAGPLFFDTRVVGYQEVITDPANSDKILIFTYPLIGNYGISEKFNESKLAQIKGVVIKEKSKIYSNWQAEDSLDAFLKRKNLVAISEVDTRSLVVHLRDKGEMWAAISTNGKRKEDLLKEIKSLKNKTTGSFINKVSTKKIRTIKGKKNIKVGILDLGLKQSLISQLSNLSFRIVILPYNTRADAILKLKLKGLIISSGPENDPVQEQIIPTIKKLIGKIPILGIALGAQLIAKSLGVKVKKMCLGHHGVNYPIAYLTPLPRSANKMRNGIPPLAGKGDITVQNHSWVVDLNSLKKTKQVKITAVHLNDATVEEFESQKYKFIAVQYDPVSPGCNETNPILRKFLQLKNGRN